MSGTGRKEQDMNEMMMMAETLTELDRKSGHFESECFRFGSTWGCRPYCPVYERGECEHQQDNTEMFINEGWIDDD